MTNGHEKSDPAIVAVKPTNEAGRPGEEPAEPRAGTEGNAGQGEHAPDAEREGASHGLDRVRKTARERKKEKFTALLHHIDVAALAEAFFDLKRTAAPGVDGLTWETYEADLERGSRICIRGSIGERIGRRPAGGSIFPNRMDGSARWRSPRWRTRSSNGRRRRC